MVDLELPNGFSIRNQIEVNYKEYGFCILAPDQILYIFNQNDEVLDAIDKYEREQ